MHLAVDRPGVFGGTSHTTLCNRLSDASDDMNRTDVDDEVTCKLCLSRMKYRKPKEPKT